MVAENKKNSRSQKIGASEAWTIFGEIWLSLALSAIFR